MRGDNSNKIKNLESRELNGNYQKKTKPKPVVKKAKEQMYSWFGISESLRNQRYWLFLKSDDAVGAGKWRICWTSVTRSI